MKKHQAVKDRHIDVSILIVSYNTKALTLEAIRSAIDQTKTLDVEIIVVDNASHDGSAKSIAENFPGIHLIALDDNLGFAAANNLASAHASGDYILLLNPDTVVLDRAIDRLVDFARANPMGGIWGGRTLFADGTLNAASCWGRMTPWNLFCRASGLTAIFPRSEIFNGESYGGWQRDSVRRVDIVSGCFLLISRRWWKKLGGFAPVFFMYGEEADLCMRASKLGAKPMVTPQATIVHLGGASENVRADKMVRLLAAKSELIERHFSAGTRPLARLLLLAWPASRTLALLLAARLTGRQHLAESAMTWAEILARRRSWRGGFASYANLQATAKPDLPSISSPASIGTAS